MKIRNRTRTNLPSQSTPEVGYAKPPVHTRFQPGKSGNPKGRGKKALKLNPIIKKTIAQKVPVTKAGITSQISLLEAMVEQLSRSAAKGTASAQKMLLKLIETYETEDERADAASKAEAVSVDPLDRELLDSFEREVLARHGVLKDEPTGAGGPRIIRGAPKGEDDS